MQSLWRAGLTVAFVYLFAAGVTVTGFGGFLWALISLLTDDDRIALVAAGVGFVAGLAAPVPIARAAWRFERSCGTEDAGAGEVGPSIDPLPEPGSGERYQRSVTAVTAGAAPRP